MTCLFFSKNNEMTFESQINLIKLTSVPFVNAVFFAKIRILKNRSSSQVSPRVSVLENEVHWKSEYTFKFKAYKNAITNVLEPVNLKISIRKEERGGNTFTKVGFVIINLSCFAMGCEVNNNNNSSSSQQGQQPASPLTQSTDGIINQSNNSNSLIDDGQVIKRKYILEGYNGKKRQDNSMLVVSIKMSNLGNNHSFLAPIENMSKCILMDETDDVKKKGQLKGKEENSSSGKLEISDQLQPQQQQQSQLQQQQQQPQTVLSKTPSTNQMPDQSFDNSNVQHFAKSRPMTASTATIGHHFQQHSRNSSSESSSIHFLPRPLSDINPKQQQILVLESILGNIKSSDEGSDLKPNSANITDNNKPKSPTSPAYVISTTSSTFQMIGKPHKVLSTRNLSTDLVSQVLQTVPSITVNTCNESNATMNTNSNTSASNFTTSSTTLTNHPINR